MSGISWQTRTERGFAGCILSMVHDGRKLDLSYKSGLLNIVAGLDIGMIQNILFLFIQS